jgi:mRNA interferase MazF
MQSDLLNHAGHPSTAVIPLTTQLIDDAVPLRFRLLARDDLKQDSDVMLDQTRTLDNRRLEPTTLTRMEPLELLTIEQYWRIVLGL